MAGRDIGMRFGTGFPGVLAAGWFYSKSFGKSYLFSRRPTYRWKKMQIEADHVVTLRLRNFTCDTIRLTIADKSLANTILHALPVPMIVVPRDYVIPELVHGD